MLQRIFAARDLFSLKTAILGLVVAAFLAELPGLLVGIVASGLLPYEEPTNIFGAMIDVVTSIGPFA